MKRRVSFTRGTQEVADGFPINQNPKIHSTRERRFFQPQKTDSTGSRDSFNQKTRIHSTKKERCIQPKPRIRSTEAHGFTLLPPRGFYRQTRIHSTQKPDSLNRKCGFSQPQSADSVNTIPRILPISNSNRKFLLPEDMLLTSPRAYKQKG